MISVIMQMVRTELRPMRLRFSWGERQGIENFIQLAAVLQVDFCVVNKTAKKVQGETVSAGDVLDELHARRIAFHGGDVAGQGDRVIVRGPEVLNTHQLSRALFGHARQDGRTFAPMASPSSRIHSWWPVFSGICRRKYLARPCRTGSAA